MSSCTSFINELDKLSCLSIINKFYECSIGECKFLEQTQWRVLALPLITHRTLGFDKASRGIIAKTRSLTTSVRLTNQSPSIIIAILRALSKWVYTQDQVLAIVIEEELNTAFGVNNARNKVLCIVLIGRRMPKRVCS